MTPKYQDIKRQLLNAIEQGVLKVGDQVESENSLAARCAVSRMTARRALTELVEEGILARSQGLGTFVSDNRPMSSMLTITGIKEEIEARGNVHSCQVFQQNAVTASAQIAQWLGLAVDDEVFMSEVVHYEDGVAVQSEQRWVNPQWAPDYLAQPLHQITAHKYLSQVAPLTEADHVVEAVLPSEQHQQWLDIAAHQPCLQITRRTFSAGSSGRGQTRSSTLGSGLGIVSYAKLTHPGHRYRLGGHLAF